MAHHRNPLTVDWILYQTIYWHLRWKRKKTPYLDIFHQIQGKGDKTEAEDWVEKEDEEEVSTDLTKDYYEVWVQFCRFVLCIENEKPQTDTRQNRKFLYLFRKSKITLIIEVRNVEYKTWVADCYTIIF